MMLGMRIRLSLVGIRPLLATFAVVIGLSTAFSPALLAQKGKENEEAKRVAEATTVFTEVMGAEDKAIPKTILDKAEAIAIFPGTIKAGLGVGGLRGRGVISARGANGWSSPAFLTITGGSIGLQIGAQSSDVVLVIMDKRGVETLISNQFKLGADAGVAAGPVGRDAQAATDLQLRAKILSYSRSRGLFAGINVNGSVVRQDKDANERFYGKALSSHDVIISGQGGSPEPVAAWRQVLARYAR